MSAYRSPEEAEIRDAVVACELRPKSPNMTGHIVTMMIETLKGTEE